MSAEPVEIVLDIDSAMAWIGAESWLLPPPSRFWHALAERFGDRFVHVLPKGALSRREEVQRAVSAAARRGAEAVVGRVQLAGGRCSAFLSRPQMLAYLPLAPGALLCRADAAARAAADISDAWDPHWARDLALALARRGPVVPFDCSLAGPGDEAPTASRLPPDRARLGPHSEEGGFILVYGRLGASTSLYFDGLPMAERARIRMLEPGDLFSDLHWLAAASLVIVVRGFEFAERNGALDLLLELGTPVLWFTDDDFIVLGRDSASLGHYRAETVRRFAARLVGIVTTSAPLAGALAHYHRDVTIMPLAADPVLLARRPAVPGHRAAVVGGGFRAKALRDVVAPAARAEGVRLIVPAGLPHAPFDALRLPFEGDFAQFVFRWQAEAPFALLHPQGDSANIANKSRGTLLVAAYLGAVPIVAQEPAYHGLAEEDGVLTAGGAVADWQAQIARLNDTGFQREMLARLDGWVARACKADAAGVVLRQLAAKARNDGPLAAADRLGRALESRALQQALPRQSAPVRHWRRFSASLGRRIDRLVNRR